MAEEGCDIYEDVRQRLSTWLVRHRDEGVLLSIAARRPSSAREALDRQLELHRWLARSGWFTFGWPKAVGGTGWDPLLRAYIYEALTLADIEPPVTVNSVEVIGPALLKYGAALARSYLPKLIAGEEAWCQGFSEPEAGSDLASLRMRGRRDGETWCLSGQKLWSTRGAGSDRCLVLTRTGTAEERHRGLSLFLVDMTSPGITANPIQDMSGTEHFAEIFFDDVIVASERLVGEAGEGWKISMQLFQWERGMYAWLRQASLRRYIRVLAEATAGDVANQRQLGKVLQDLVSLRARSLQTISALARDTDCGPRVSIDKLLLSRAERSVQELARQVAPLAVNAEADGTWPSRVYEYLHSRVATIYGGSSEIQKTIVATQLLGLPR